MHALRSPAARALDSSFSFNLQAHIHDTYAAQTETYIAVSYHPSRRLSTALCHDGAQRRSVCRAARRSCSRSVAAAAHHALCVVRCVPEQIQIQAENGPNRETNPKPYKYAMYSITITVKLTIDNNNNGAQHAHIGTSAEHTHRS